ncbi:SusC/RagA family TonB-linked outer membrane protein [Fulvivirgaceae bacterium BMA10]|uniref:SusC/RagA family TonB-linked outer membrane protein n=1 Tax=Splendidivirga corallicola TaxID=3051826 RepID=A0ABT8KU84_9BACT|nr:SusC/RagA family TonB-linked outer membrane protein [Fulvivirgaceae bacterium BMA10]
MKSSLQRQLIYMSKLLIYSFVIQCMAYNFILAHSGMTQNLSDVFLTINLKKTSLEKALSKIEKETDFKFLYSDGSIDLKNVSNIGSYKDASLREILLSISKTNHVRFKRINNTIIVDPLEKESLEEKIVVEIDEKTITGKVTDEDANALPGVNVLVKDTNTGTVTDINGNYSLNVPDDVAILVFSYVGYITEEVDITGRTTVDLVLTPDIETLSEVVVVGYGSQKRANVSSAIASIDQDELNNISYANTASLLQGKVAGVNVENSGGAPGTGAVVVIRGTGTLSNNDQPLYVVDGSIVGDISYLNANDIENVQVLKDASAAAIYGNRAANGVIIVTTKRGEKGDIRINFNSKIGVQSETNRLDLLDGEAYIAARNQSIANSGGATDDLFVWNGVSTDWQDVQLDNAMYQDYSLSVSGGGENATYYISGQYLNQDGIVNSSGYERYNLRANSSFSKGRFKLDQNFLLTRELKDANSYFFREFGPIPVQEVFDENNEGGFADAPAQYNSGRPVNWYGISELEDDLSTVDRALLNLSPSFEIIDGLTYKYNLSINYSNNHFRLFVPTFFVSANPGGSNNIASLNESFTRTLDILSEHTLTYAKSIGDHDFTALIGYTTQKVKSRQAGGRATEFGSNDLRTLSAGNDNTDVFGALGENALASILGRITYSYKGKYLLNASIRTDETSRFVESERKGSFPSFSLGWRISEEDFFPKDGIISDLKLRGSWGQLGNQNVGNYDTQSTININNGYAIGNVPRSGSTVLNLSNPSLFWETTTSSDIGIDLELLDGKISIVTDYFVKKSEDILVNLPIPVGGGQGSFLRTNAATMENRGFEFLIGYHDKLQNGLSFDGSLNFTTLTNEVTALGEGVSPIVGGRYNQGGEFATLTDVGHPIASFYGHVVEGIYQTQAEIDADGRTGQAELGDINFMDLDGDNDIDDDDRDFLGSSIPSFQVGLNLAATYKNFDLNLFITSVQGVELFNTRWNDNLFLTSEGGDYLAEAANAWTPSNTNTNIPRLVDARTADNERPSDFYVEDGSYTRLKNIELGYTLPTGLLPENSIQNIRFFVSAQNILTLTDYTGFDPEVGRSFAGGAVGSSNGSIFGAGIDRAYPTAKTFFVGLQATF